MEIAVPFPIFPVRETGVCVFINHPVHFKVFLVAGSFIGIKCGDDGFALRPPEFHIVPVFLLRKVLAVFEISDSTVCFVPAPFPGPVEDSQSHFFQFRVPVAVLGFFQDEPGCLDRMARIDGSSGDGVDEFAIRSDCFEDCFEFRLHEVAAEFADGLVYLFCQYFIVDSFADAGGRINQYHA